MAFKLKKLVSKKAPLVPICIKVDKDLKKKFEEACKQDGTNTADGLRQLIGAYLDQRKAS